MLFTVLAERPAVRINQLGYLPDGPKRATWVTDGAVPVEFIIEATDGSVVFRGRSQPWPNRPEPTSGLAVFDFAADDWTDVAFRRGRLALFVTPRLLKQTSGD